MTFYAYVLTRHVRRLQPAVALQGFAALLVVQALLATAWASQPHDTSSGPGIIPIGSPLTFGGTNAPDTYTATTTFSSTPVLVDNGAVQIWQVQTPTGPSSEWDLFYMKTVNGGPLAGNINGNWNLVISYTLSQAVDFDQVINQWLVNGTPVSPITDGIGTICCAVTTNPILPGPAYYKSGFSGPLPAGVESNWQQIYVDPYNYVTSGGIDPSTANEFIFGLHFTLQAPTVTGVISASAFGAFPTFAPGSWIEIYGTNLASGTATWQASDFDGVNAPTKVGGTSVTIGGESAFVDYVSSLQVNVQVPGGIGTGPLSLVVTNAVGSSPPFTVNVDQTQPGLLAPVSFKVGSTQYVVAQFSDLTYVLPPGVISGVAARRAKPGDTVVIYGVGFGSVTPDVPPGQIAEETTKVALPLTVSIGGVPATVSYDGLAPNYVGLYQFNVVIPSVPPNDATPLTFSLNGVSGTQDLVIAIGN
ncbi:MAG TPA: IPT/TIG domain-containing protein [Bryobacteraceae bacterium]|nr:IPT/TIG domain-containing protein [Bryobacteraceae bacterium]